MCSFVCINYRCPDCVYSVRINDLIYSAADPVIDLFLEDQTDNTVLVCLVKREGYKVMTILRFLFSG